MAADFNNVFKQLRELLLPCATELVCTEDSADAISLDTHHIMKNGKPLYFGAVQIRKRYVSYHLMPVYVEPSLLDGISDALRKRMQGKSCFNFTTPDPEIFTELAELTRAGYEMYRKEGYV